jgi:hypothetical protein
MKAKLKFCGLLTLFAYCVIMPATERRIKKAKIDETPIASILCRCGTCSHMRRDAWQWEHREIVIAQALLSTRIDKNLADIIYQYVDYYPSLCRWHWDMRGNAFSFAKYDQKLTHLCLVTHAPLDDIRSEQKTIHIVPQEVCFDYDAFTRADAILYNVAQKGNHSITIRSLCKCYYVQFKSHYGKYKTQDITVSPYCPNISESPGWQRALADLKAQE